jgi:TM2 domain-containing membrane protein YozV
VGLIYCPECRKEASDRATVCPYCGYPFPHAPAPETPSPGRTTQPANWNPGIAAVLSLIIPGAGQMYKGQVGWGIVWLLCVSAGYALLILPGLILHLFCILNAAKNKAAT